MTKKTSLLLLALVVVILLGSGYYYWRSAASSRQPAPTVVDQLEEAPTLVNLPNPLVEYSSLTDAAADVGFSLEDQDGLLSIYEPTYTVINHRVLQIAYTDKLQTITVRKALADHEDISGDYNTYQKNALATIGEDGIAATLRGDEGMISSAYWQLGDYSYSLHADLPLTTSLAKDIILSVK